MKNTFDGTLKSVARSEAMKRLRTNEALEEENEEMQSLLKQIFSDITKDNKLSPDTFDKLVEVVE